MSFDDDDFPVTVGSSVVESFDAMYGSDPGSTVRHLLSRLSLSGTQWPRENARPESGRLDDPAQTATGQLITNMHMPSGVDQNSALDKQIEILNTAHGMEMQNLLFTHEREIQNITYAHGNELERSERRLKEEMHHSEDQHNEEKQFLEDIIRAHEHAREKACQDLLAENRRLKVAVVVLWLISLVAIVCLLLVIVGRHVGEGSTAQAKDGAFLTCF